LLNDSNLPAFSGLIVDYHMPAMNGLDLIARLRERQNYAPAILITGRVDAVIREHASAAGVPVIENPVRGTALIECIREILDGNARVTSSS
jgi:two-component system response regulator FixJ